MNDVLVAILSLSFAAQVLHVAVPYALAALGGAVTERAGVIDLALEGKLLFGAFTAAAIGHATGSAGLGIVGGMAAGMVVAAIQIGLALGLAANQVIIGVALNALGASGTRFLLQLVFHEGANSPPCPSYGDALVSNPIVWLAVVATAVVPFALRRTRWGVRLRAAGDRPDALVAVGVSPIRVRLAAALVGGALAGAGGAELSLSVGGFTADMAGGRGYMALAMVILAGWRPAWAAVACVGVALTNMLGYTLESTGVRVAPELLGLLPYVTTLIVLVIAGGRRPPRALGQI